MKLIIITEAGIESPPQTVQQVLSKTDPRDVISALIESLLLEGRWGRQEIKHILTACSIDCREVKVLEERGLPRL